MFLNTLHISKPRMRVIKLILFLLIGLIAVSMDSCKKKPPTPPDCYDPANPDCVNYDPCYGKEMPTADFLIEDEICDNNLECVFIADDLIFLGVNILFKPTYEDENKYTHIWYIGTETLSTYQVIRDFSKVPRPANITVSHVIHYQPDTVCFPDDKGIDSMSRTFYLIKYYNELNTFGKYRGVLNNEKDSFDMEITFLDKSGGDAVFNENSGLSFQRFINFNNEQDTIDDIYFIWSGNNFGFFYGSGGGNPKGTLTIDTVNHIVKMEYKFRSRNQIFYGRKLN
jgi:hypothetical protein